jgi:hypothetical protein
MRLLTSKDLLDAFAAGADFRPCRECGQPTWQCACEVVCIECGQVLSKDEMRTFIAEPRCYGCEL